MKTVKVFLSFAAEDSAFKRNFTNPEWFGNFLPPVEFIDYQMGENLPFGSLNDWINQEVRSAAVFVAFISKNYIAKKYPSKEWWLGLSEAARRELMFVPVMLDGSAKGWWKEQKQNGGLQDLGDDYAYSDFTDGSGRPCLILTELGPVDKVIRRIGELARLVRAHLEQRATASLPADTDERGDDQLQRPGPQSTDRHHVVVLGHPSAISSPTVRSYTEALIAALVTNEVSHERWGDQWRTNPSARRGSSRPSPPGKFLFVQPTDSGEAGDLADSRLKLRKWLERIFEAELRVPSTSIDRAPVLWLPEGCKDDIFTNIARETHADDDLVLRSDDASALAGWIRNEVRGCAREAISVLTLEEVDVNDAGKLRHALHSSFHALVGEVVQPKPELWTFDGEMLAEQISKLEADRAIVAVHDLNTGTAHGQREARLQLERKLGAIGSEVDRAVLTSGRKDIKLFWSALLVQKADQLPWVKYPAPSQFENWCLLPYVAAGADDGGGLIVRPKQGATNVFRTYLRDWMKEPQL
jgi:hypothetical protein